MPKEPQKSADNAFVVTYYGGDGTLIETAVLGESLRRSGSRSDKIAIVRKGVEQWRIDALANFFQIREVDSFPLSGWEMAKNTLGRFHGVFDKLMAWNFTEYRKIALVDADMLVLKNPDDLFRLPTPAGCFFGPPFAWQAGKRIEGGVIRSNAIQKPGFLNIGLVLLQPGRDTYEELGASLRERVTRGERFEFPEQDFLREFFIDHWHTIEAYYNFSPRNLLWGIPHSIWGKGGDQFRVEDLVIVHFARLMKPLQFLFHPEPTTALLRAERTYTNAVKEFSQMLEIGNLPPLMRDDSSSPFSSIMSEWMLVYRDLLKEPYWSSIFSRLRPEPYFSEVELKKHVQDATAKFAANEAPDSIKRSRPRTLPASSRRRLRFL